MIFSLKVEKIWTGRWKRSECRIPFKLRHSPGPAPLVLVVQFSVLCCDGLGFLKQPNLVEMGKICDIIKNAFQKKKKKLEIALYILNTYTKKLLVKVLVNKSELGYGMWS